MEALTPSDMKTILHSKRANLYYLEHCRLLVNGGRVEYVTEEGRKSLYWNIPIANTTSILLGTGTSITQSAMRELAKAGVLVGFCGGDGTPLFAANEVQVDVSWLTSQSEYRPTEYLQHWVSFWFDEAKRTEAARRFQFVRLEQISQHWLGTKIQREDSFIVDESKLRGLLTEFRKNTEQARDTNEILTQEARLTKALYKIAANTMRYGDFTRSKRGAGVDVANRFLDHGNYMAYGLGATAAWVLGLPHGLSVLHGKTRRGGLVFDVADLVKDALVLPQAFIAAMNGEDDMEFRQRCTQGFNRFGALDVMIDCLKDTAFALSEVRK